MTIADRVAARVDRGCGACRGGTRHRQRRLEESRGHRRARRRVHAARGREVQHRRSDARQRALRNRPVQRVPGVLQHPRHRRREPRVGSGPSRSEPARVPRHRPLGDVQLRGNPAADLRRHLAVDAVVNAHLAPDQHDTVIVLVNDEEYGGSGGGVSVSSTGPEMGETLLHELGHTLGLLADEYGGGGGPDCFATEPWEVNVTTVTTPRLDQVGHVDQHEHTASDARRALRSRTVRGREVCDLGMYRPTVSSKVRALSAFRRSQ